MALLLDFTLSIGRTHSGCSAYIVDNPGHHNNQPNKLAMLVDIVENAAEILPKSKVLS
jgi:hypothetical protein